MKQHILRRYRVSFSRINSRLTDSRFQLRHGFLLMINLLAGILTVMTNEVSERYVEM